jgi:hypothetical protein
LNIGRFSSAASRFGNRNNGSSGGRIEDDCQCSRHAGHHNTENHNIMKKFAIIALAVVVSSVGLTFAASSLRNVEEHSKGEAGYRCHFCKGSGFGSNNRNCVHCKGTGRNSSY